MSDKKSVGQKIMQLRKEQGYKRDAFAEKIGIPSTTLRNYELGVHEPGHSFIIQMARLFSVSTDYLLGLSEDRTPGCPAHPDDDRVSESEMGMLKAIRRLDGHGKRMVELVLAEEIARVEPEE